MAVLNRRFITYLKTMLLDTAKNSLPTWKNDSLATRLISNEKYSTSRILTARQCAEIDSTKTILEALKIAFPDGILRTDVDRNTERQITALKMGFPRMPATTVSVIVQGFGAQINKNMALDVYASHGLSHDMKKLPSVWNFTEINRRADGLAQALADPQGNVAQTLQQRWQTVVSWKKAPYGSREQVLADLPVSRSLFFHWWNNFNHLGILGLADWGRELFRNSKITPAKEAQIVIDRLQNPQRADSFYVRRLWSMGIEVKRDTIAKVFMRWGIREYRSVFVSSLRRLDSPIEDTDEEVLDKRTTVPVRRIDEHYLFELVGMRKYPMSINAPGIFALWAYIEELGLFELLDSMGLTRYEKRQQYSWFDLLLFDIGRHFYGIATPSAACEVGEVDLAFFANLYKQPCNDTLLEGLRKISEKQIVCIRHWLVERLTQLGLSTGKCLAFDFHHIDQDVLFPQLRNFGKGPSPKKKLCATGFRPHIAWDIEKGTLLVAEFRKASARGTTTVRRFIGEYIFPTFRGLFETVYLDSEYTGTDVWNFILDKHHGMGANLCACLKQNPLVKKARDQFLARNAQRADFWSYYDDAHVYTNDTFTIQWNYASSKDEHHCQQNLKLTCVVKKHVATGKLRCFGSSKKNVTALQILTDYSSRWIVENGIKDLVGGYFLDNCPGTDPHLVDVHFLIVSICRTLFRMIERDLGNHMKNADGTIKTLSRIREILFRTGPATIKVNNDSFSINYLNAFSHKISPILKDWFEVLAKRHSGGLSVLGGFALDFKLLCPVGEERRNSGTKLPFSVLKKID